jgi:hypothetical protein
MRPHSLVIALAIACAGGLAAELNDTPAPKLDHPSIAYRTKEADDPVAALKRKLKSGAVRLKYEEPAGYLRSLLEALNIPVQSQIAVFSKTSLQAPLINQHNPRTLFFNDSVVAGWMHGGLIELASLDPRRGFMFYVLPQTPARPEFQRRLDCLQCHLSDVTLGVPGMMIRSTFTAPDDTLKLIYGASVTDHRTPLEDRWGGWYVTGSAGANRHLGNAVVTGDDPTSMITAATLNAATLTDKFETNRYLSAYSDIAALMVFDHQMHMTNLITRLGWEARVSPRSSLADSAREVVDYLLFVDEAPLKGPIRGTSGFTETFAAQGPRDRKGRSLRDLDLQHRVFRYPCSYMIYSEAFDALPAEAKDAIYKRMWQILSGGESGTKYARFTAADRRAILEILSDTKKDLPAWFPKSEYSR